MFLTLWKRPLDCQLLPQPFCFAAPPPLQSGRSRGGATLHSSSSAAATPGQPVRQLPPPRAESCWGRPPQLHPPMSLPLQPQLWRPALALGARRQLRPCAQPAQAAQLSPRARWAPPPQRSTWHPQLLMPPPWRLPPRQQLRRALVPPVGTRGQEWRAAAFQRPTSDC